MLRLKCCLSKIFQNVCDKFMVTCSCRVQRPRCFKVIGEFLLLLLFTIKEFENSEDSFDWFHVLNVQHLSTAFLVLHLLCPVTWKLICGKHTTKWFGMCCASHQGPHPLSDSVLQLGRIFDMTLKLSGIYCHTFKQHLMEVPVWVIVTVNGLSATDWQVLALMKENTE